MSLIRTKYLHENNNKKKKPNNSESSIIKKLGNCKKEKVVSKSINSFCEKK